ncbi:cercosporin resistance [Fusarium heterosporum]|uniref:Cercosporin resistance n=1 Tax=Fusarium heterosporum TaxID=42747 RepID=A0A8H5TFH8_FUSHE|nr:cercosporin resistance [Fusarium heterosporum]
MKCQWPSSGSGRVENTCSRCCRMKLDCRVPQVTQRKKRGKSTRVAQLEKKIDGIVSLLANQHKGLSPLTPESPQETQPQVHSNPHNEPVSIPPLVPIGLNTISIPTQLATDLELFPGFRVSQQQAAECINVYRRDYVPNFPFVPVPKHITPHELYAESSLLFWTILAVVSPLEEKVQLEFKLWFRRYLAEHVIVQQERTVDILQSILIYLGWNDFHFYGELQVTNIVQMAIGLVIDLRLDKHSGFLLGGPKTLLGDAWTSMGKPCPKAKLHQMPADKRAVLGVYHITNLKSTLFNWSAHLSQCCDTLDENREYESDLYLVSLVRMQHMADRGFSVIPPIDLFDPSPPVFQAVTAMALDTVHRELKTFFESQPDRIRSTPGFKVHYHSLLVRLYEPVLAMKPVSLSTPETPLSEPFQRSEYLWKCLESICDALEYYSALPAAQFSILPVTVSCVLAFVTVTASRTVLGETSSDWDVKSARRRLQFQTILEKLSDQFAQADEEAQRLNRRRRVMEDGSSVFLKSSFKVRWIRQWYLSKIPQEEQQEPQTAMEPSTVLQSNPNWAANFQFDDEFWADLMAGYDVESLEKSLTTVAAVQ